MIVMGDESGRTQGGNSNAYCQDNEISWLRWEGLDPLDSAFAGFVATALAIRRSYPELRQPDFLHGEPAAEAGSPNVQWLGAGGTTTPEAIGRAVWRVGG